MCEHCSRYRWSLYSRTSINHIRSKIAIEQSLAITIDCIIHAVELLSTFSALRLSKLEKSEVKKSPLGICPNLINMRNSSLV